MMKMINAILISIVSLLNIYLLNAQSIYKSIHQIESEYYSKNLYLIDTAGTNRNFSPRFDLLKPVLLSKVVYGFHPYWISDATAANYYYSLLTHIAYFSAEVDNSPSSNGGFFTTRGWATTQVVNYAKRYNVKVHLTVTLFSNHSVILNNNTNRQNLINNILTQINLRNADGCNIDFESMSSSVADSFRTFIYQLGTALKSQGKELVVELPAVDWQNIFTQTFFNHVNSVVDFYFLMAYDYYWSGSSTAGPVSPLTSGTAYYHVTRSINTYLSRNCPKSKLIAGFPYYGYDWPVQSNVRMSTTTGSGSARYYSRCKTMVDTLPAVNKFLSDPLFNVPWFRYTSGTQWRQVWYDDSLSLSKKYDSVKAIGIAGTGMWALGYDDSRTELWGALKEAFASKSEQIHTILADFEWSVDPFYTQPTYSGSTVGISTSSTSARTVGMAYNGAASLEIILKDNPSSSNDWVVRLLSGAGSPSNNMVLNSTGYIGFYMKTSTAPHNAKVAITIDDQAGGTELSSRIDVINDGQWHLYQWNLQGSGWTSFAGGNGIINGPTVTLDAIMFYAPNNSNDWTIYLDDVSYYQFGPLPVELLTFYASVFNDKVKLYWITANEVNNLGWEIERLKVGADIWVKIGFVEGNGTSNAKKEYIFFDNPLQEGLYLYRLKQIDFDGNFKYSEEIKVEFAKKSLETSLDCYPIPTNSEIIISFFLPNATNVELSLYNLLGEKIRSVISNEMMEKGSYLKNITLNEFSSGVYLIKLKTEKTIATKKFVLVK